MEEPDEISLKLLVEDILGRAEIQLITEGE